MCASVHTLCTARTHAEGSERGNDVHEVLSLITRFASAPAARTIVSRPAFELCEVSVCLHRIRYDAYCVSDCVIDRTFIAGLRVIHGQCSPRSFLRRNFLWTCELSAIKNSEIVRDETVTSQTLDTCAIFVSKWIVREEEKKFFFRFLQTIFRRELFKVLLENFDH